MQPINFNRHIGVKTGRKFQSPPPLLPFFSQPLPVTSGKPENSSKPVSSWRKYQNRQDPFQDHSWVPVLHHEVPTGIPVYLCLRRACKSTAVWLSTPLLTYFITPLAHDFTGGIGLGGIGLFALSLLGGIYRDCMT